MLEPKENEVKDQIEDEDRVDAEIGASEELSKQKEENVIDSGSENEDEAVSELDKLQAELNDYKNRYMRLYAEFDNARKRMEREKQEFVKYANEDLIVDFLSVLDNLELSVKAAETQHEDQAAFLKGMQMVMTQTHDLLKKSGVNVIETDGKKFDPHCHEILMQEESDSSEDGEILEVFQKGYMLYEKVIRTAKIKVAQSKS